MLINDDCLCSRLQKSILSLNATKDQKSLAKPPCERPSAIEQPLKIYGTQNANCQQLHRSWQCEKLGAVPIQTVELPPAAECRILGRWRLGIRSNVERPEQGAFGNCDGAAICAKADHDLTTRVSLMSAMQIWAENQIKP